jgi:hypothetical protein
MVKTMGEIGKVISDVNKNASTAIKKKSNAKKPAKKTLRLRPATPTLK